jgi:hypothetical protein
MRLINKIFICIAILSLPYYAIGQKQGNIWCFGDSSGIDFNTLINPIPSNSSMVSRGSCLSHCDKNGNLLYYSSTDAANASFTSAKIWNKNHSVMDGGDSIAGSGWYNELVSVNQPQLDSCYYIFSIGVTLPYGLMYSVIDIRLDGGFGSVVQKNVPLLSGLMVDCVTAIKVFT